MLTLPAKCARKSGGFTLIELVITITVLAIALMIGLPSFQDWIRNAQIRTAAESIKNGLQMARLEAIKSNTPVIFSLVNDGSTFWQIVDVRTDNTLQESTEKFNQVTIRPTPGSDFAFNGLGRQWTTKIGAKSPPDAAIASVDVSLPTVPNTRPLTVTVTAGGSVRLCDPAVHTSGDPRKC
ncbi:MAG: GspH/FimT family pseudopilin [Zoogloeaceae bacterium]|jgi:type IV fimbrial biogenesis protein FimT|nr:GspH/FimT family pseudopilin [Zoogloeaceae bacterium]